MTVWPFLHSLHLRLNIFSWIKNRRYTIYYEVNLAKGDSLRKAIIEMYENDQHYT